jgi:signal transduction histidine kinase/ligand-binding sensor domain-containing protein
MRRILPIPLALFFMAQPAMAQDYIYKVRQHRIAPSKSSNHIRSFERDAYGMIWATTDDGLVRFDGFRFDRFREGAPPLGLREDALRSSCIHGGILYAGDSRGIQAYDLSNYGPKRLEGIPAEGSPANRITVDREGRIWWYSADGFLNRYAKGRLDRREVGIFNCQALAESDGAIWMAARERHLAVDTGSLSILTDSVYKAANINANFVTPPDGGLQLLCLGRLIRLQRGISQGNAVEESLSQVTHIVYGNGGRFLVQNKNLVVHQYMSGGRLRQDTVPLGIDVPFYISDIRNYGNHLVVGTSLGLVLVDYRINLFNPIRSTLIEGVGLYDDPRGIAEDSTRYYLSGYQYLVAYDKTRQRSEILNSEGLLSHGIAKDGDTLWIASEGNGLIAFDLKSRRYQRITKDTLYKNRFLITLAPWGERLVIGGYQNLMYFDKRTRRFEYPPIRYNALDVSASMVKKIEPIGTDSCLLGTDMGVFLIDRDFKVLRQYKYAPGEEYGPADRVNDIVRVADGSFWVATYEGLNHYDIRGKLLKRLTRNDGLAGNVVASLALDGYGFIWAGTYDGLSKVNPVSREVVNYFKEDGLPDNEFNHSSVLRASSGEVLLGTVSGFIRFYPGTLGRQRESAERIGISRIDYGSRNGQSTVYNPYSLGDTVIRIGKDLSYAKLHFFSNPLQTQENPTYEYMIEGVHSEWLNMGSQPVLYLDNARAGSYRLRVRFISGSGSKAVLERSFPIVVEQYFYTRPWFYALLFALLLSLLLLYIRSNIVRQRNLRELRMELAQDLHDEIGGYITGITMNVDLLRKDLNTQNPYMRTIGLLGRKALFALKDGLWSLDTKSDNAQELWDRIKSITKDTLEPLDMGYRFKQVEGLEGIGLSIMEKRNLVYIAKECLTNAIKHGDGGFVNLEWEVREGIHSIRIWNRVGKEPSASERGGHGLLNIENRMMRIGGRMGMANEKGIFTVTLKLDFLHDKIGNRRRQ